MCYRTRKTLVNPIIDWTDEDVWEFIHKRNVPYCDLYDKGAKRLGCIGCPMNSNAQQELDSYPKYKEQYIRCFNKMYQNRVDRGLPNHSWNSGKDIYEWWVKNGDKTYEELRLFEMEGE